MPDDEADLWTRIGESLRAERAPACSMPSRPIRHPSPALGRLKRAWLPGRAEC